MYFRPLDLLDVVEERQTMIRVAGRHLLVPTIIQREAAQVVDRLNDLLFRKLYLPGTTDSIETLQRSILQKYENNRA